jgi:predicted phosphodiesterase
VELVCLADSDTVRIAASGEVFRSRNGQAAYYWTHLSSLKPDQHYAYRAATDGRTSPWYHFKTYAANRQKMSFLYVGDVQDTLGGQANRLLREALYRHPESEFLVCGGDLTERPTHQHWEEAFRDVDSVAQTMPLLVVTGNHDYLKGVIMRLERRFSLVFSYFLDSKVADNQVYTLCYGPVQFFLLDSNRELPYLYTQRQWLKEQLQQSHSQWKIVVLHHPLYSIKGNNNLIQRWMFNDLIKEYGVDLVLQGHEHAYARMTCHDDKGHAVTPVYTVSHCSPKNYRIEFDDRFDKFGISSRYYQTIAVSGDTLSLTAYEVYGHTPYDSLQIIKSAKGQVSIRDFGKTIPEYMDYEPDPNSKKDRAFAERIADYKHRHPERLK